MKALIDNPKYTVTKPPSDTSLDDTLRANDVLHKRNKQLPKRLYEELINVKKERQILYREQSSLFFFIGLSLSLLFSVVVFNWKTYDNPELVDLGQVEGDFDEILEVPVSSQPPPPAPKKLETFVLQEVADEQIIEDIDLDLDVEVTEKMAVEDVVYENIEVEEIEEKAEEIFQVVEDQPTFPGGIAAFYTYVQENIEYPAVARRLGISGRVFVRFVIEKDGKPSQVTVLKGISEECDAEAVRVIKNSPSWIPGKQRGRPVRVYMTVPINFYLKDN